MFITNTAKEKYLHMVDVEKLPISYSDKKEVKLFGKTVLVGLNEWSWHLHLKLTDNCNGKCYFCVEQIYAFQVCKRRTDKQKSFSERGKPCSYRRRKGRGVFPAGIWWGKSLCYCQKRVYGYCGCGLLMRRFAKALAAKRFCSAMIYGKPFLRRTAYLVLTALRIAFRFFPVPTGRLIS